MWVEENGGGVREISGVYKRPESSCAGRNSAGEACFMKVSFLVSLRCLILRGSRRRGYSYFLF